jgi:hypothetical protein
MKLFRNYISEATKIPFTMDYIKKQFETILFPLIDKELTPAQISKVSAKLSDDFLYSLSFRKAPGLESGDMSIFGFYDAAVDKNRHQKTTSTGASGEKHRTANTDDMPIEIILLFSKSDKTLALTREGVQTLIHMIAETLSHEWIHMVQAQKRNWIDSKAKKQYLHKIENQEVGSYLANPDEIEAYAWNIAGGILQNFNNSKTKALNFLKSPKTGIDLQLDLYMQTFVSIKHPAMKKLFKKLVIFIDKRSTAN